MNSYNLFLLEQANGTRKACQQRQDSQQEKMREMDFDPSELNPCVNRNLTGIWRERNMVTIFFLLHKVSEMGNIKLEFNKRFLFKSTNIISWISVGAIYPRNALYRIVTKCSSTVFSFLSPCPINDLSPSYNVVLRIRTNRIYDITEVWLSFFNEEISNRRPTCNICRP